MFVLNKKAEKFIPFLSSIPLLVFMLTVRMKGLLQAPTGSTEWSIAFYYGALAAIMVIAVHLITKTDLNRFILSIDAWLIASAALFLINNERLLNLMDKYKGPFFFMVFILTGIIAMLWLPGGFTDFKNVSPEKNQKLSQILLAACVVAFIWSLIFNNSGFAISIVVPFIALRIFLGMMLGPSLVKKS